MKLGIGILGAGVLTILAAACSGSEQTDATGSVDSATLVAALSVNGDGADDTWTDGASDGEAEPIVARGCGFAQIMENVVARYDADDSGDLDADEKAELESRYGDADGDTPAAHPNHGQPGKAALLLQAYDADGSGTLEASEIDVLKADIQARCEARLGRLIAEFDTDGDGQLSDTEWDAAKAALRQRFTEHHEGAAAEFDTDGDGTLDAEERAAMIAAARERRAAAEHEFDSDGDGRLGEDEQEEFEEHVRDCVRNDIPVGEHADGDHASEDESTDDASEEADEAN